MASKEDRLLAALRSLSSPKDGAGDPPEGPPGPPQSRQPENAEAGRRRPRTLELSMEEAGVFFLAAVVLVVLAFLMGWYGRDVSLPGAGPRGAARGPDPGGARPRLAIDGAAARDLGSPPPGVRPSPAGRVVYTIVAARFPAAGATDAADYRALLEEHGFAPAFLRPTEPSTELCVGRFASQSDPVLLAWLPRVRRLRETFAGAFVAQISERRAPPEDARMPSAPVRGRRPLAFVRRPAAAQTRG